jgi:hypothetical protein
VGSRLNRAQLFARAATVTVIVCVAVSPSPVAVTTIFEEPVAAPCAAVSLSDTWFVFTLEDGPSELVDQVATTPLGKPLTLKLTLPVNDPPVTAVN